MYFAILDDLNFIIGIVEENMFINEKHIKINEELYNYLLLESGKKKFVGEVITDEVLFLSDKDKFEFVIEPTPKTEIEILEEKLKITQDAVDFILMGGI